MDILDTKSIQQSLPGVMADKQVSALKNSIDGGDGKKSEKLKSLSKQFESIMTHQLLSAMRSTVPKSELFGGFSGEMYQSMMDQELANQVSKGKGIGLADMVHRQLVQLDNKINAGHTVTNSTNPGPMALNPTSSGMALKSTDFIELNKNSNTAGAMMRASKSYKSRL